MRRVNRAEFVSEMRQFVNTAANEMFNAYEDKYDYNGHLFAEKSGYFKGVVAGIMKVVVSYSSVDCKDDVVDMQTTMEKILNNLGVRDYRDELIGGCVALVELAANVIYGKEEGGTGEWV